MNSKPAHVWDAKWRSEDVQLLEEAEFSSLLLPERLLKGLKKAGFFRPSPIQLEAIPIGRFGKDLLVQAKSGTGKTLVFTIIALDSLKHKKFHPQALILAPTREIAVQICSVINAVGCTYPNLTCRSFIGGLSFEDDKEHAYKTQIVVGTPGRIKQLLEMESLPTSSIKLFVMDEVDQLLQDSFKEDMQCIFSYLPQNKQVISTSATYPERIQKALVNFLRDPYIISLTKKELSLLGIVHCTKIVRSSPVNFLVYKHKLMALEQILTTLKFSQCLVFCNSIPRVDMICNKLKSWGFSAAYISSAKEQSERLEAIESLKLFKCKVLVSSDLTSRGIDAENVDLVINFDLPYNPETYLHRVGRAGRYGSKGLSITLITMREISSMRQIEKIAGFRSYKLPDPLPKDLIKCKLFNEYTFENADETTAGNPSGDSSENTNGKAPEVLNEDTVCKSINSNGLAIEKDMQPTENSVQSSKTENINGSSNSNSSIIEVDKHLDQGESLKGTISDCKSGETDLHKSNGEYLNQQLKEVKNSLKSTAKETTSEALGNATPVYKNEESNKIKENIHMDNETSKCKSTSSVNYHLESSSNAFKNGSCNRSLNAGNESPVLELMSSETGAVLKDELNPFVTTITGIHNSNTKNVPEIKSDSLITECGATVLYSNPKQDSYIAIEHHAASLFASQISEKELPAENNKEKISMAIFSLNDVYDKDSDVKLSTGSGKFDSPNEVKETTDDSHENSSLAAEIKKSEVTDLNCIVKKFLTDFERKYGLPGDNEDDSAVDVFDKFSDDIFVDLEKLAVDKEHFYYAVFKKFQNDEDDEIPKTGEDKGIPVADKDDEVPQNGDKLGKHEDTTGNISTASSSNLVEFEISCPKVSETLAVNREFIDEGNMDKAADSVCLKQDERAEVCNDNVTLNCDKEMSNKIITDSNDKVNNSERLSDIPSIAAESNVKSPINDCEVFEDVVFEKPCFQSSTITIIHTSSSESSDSSYSDSNNQIPKSSSSLSTHDFDESEDESLSSSSNDSSSFSSSTEHSETKVLQTQLVDASNHVSRSNHHLRNKMAHVRFASKSRRGRLPPVQSKLDFLNQCVCCKCVQNNTLNRHTFKSGSSRGPNCCLSSTQSLSHASARPVSCSRNPFPAYSHSSRCYFPSTHLSHGYAGPNFCSQSTCMQWHNEAYKQWLHIRNSVQFLGGF